jgi:hypothetical protein
LIQDTAPHTVPGVVGLISLGVITAICVAGIRLML